MKKHPLVRWGIDWTVDWSNAKNVVLQPMINNGFTPFVIWNSDHISLGQIVNGSQDAYIRSWAQGAASWGQTFYLAWGTEPNNNLFPREWSGINNGGANGGATNYIAAWRRIHDIFTNAGADNVKWVWIPCYDDYMPSSYYTNPAWQRDNSWNWFYNYYPGDAYVDWVGVITYNYGDVANNSGAFWTPIAMMTDRVLNTSARRFPSKPQLVITASIEDPNNPNRKAAWIADTFAKMKTYQNVRAVMWQQDYDPSQSFPITSSQAALKAYRTAVSSPYYLITMP